MQQKYRLIWLLNLLILIVPSVNAQDTQQRYLRKSISYVDALLPIGAAIGIKPEQERQILRTVQSEIEMSRFDYNPLPDHLTEAFRNEMKNRRLYSIDAVADLMNEVLVPEIMRIVDLEKEMRAQGLVTEAEKNSFVVQKAKETGITAEDLEAVMNAAYLYMPVISKVSIDKDRKNNSATATVSGGILWFKINSQGDTTKVDLLVKKEATGSNVARLDGSFLYGGRSLDGAQYAFASAIATFARNLKIATQAIPEFQLTNPLTAAGRGWVELPMGRSEGLGIDDKFIIAEYYRNDDGSLTQKKLGMVRISQVSSDPQKSSRARTVIGGGFQRGMVALEHPRLPIDLSFRFAILPVSVDSGWTFIGKDEFNNPLGFEQDANSRIYVGQLWFNYNLGRTTKISQFFLSLVGEIGGCKLEGGQNYSEDMPTGLYWGTGVGLTKKFYLNRLHLGIETLVKYANYEVSGTTPSSDYNHDWSLQISNFGLQVNGNLEIALGYDLNIGAGLSYSLFSATNNWAVKTNDPIYDEYRSDEWSKLDFSGVGFQLYLTWSIPSLGYDPLAAARGIIGH